MSRAAEEQAGQRGGWGWLLLPVLLMFVGSNLAFGLFMLRLSNLAEAGAATRAVGPVIWSVLQMVLLWIAVRRLRILRVSLGGLIGFERERLLRDLGVGVVIAGAGTAVILLSLRAVEPIFGVGTVPFPTWGILWWTTIGAVTAGIGEETYFRGFLFERFGRLSAPALLVVTSLAFAVWHASPVMLLHTFLGGILLGWVYLRTRRLFPVIVGHTFTNVVGGITFLSAG
ncbi:MAG: CPBP family intramembrane metalloprotease [Acidobacteria bacterium]|nr:type II CAAX endopeptidase family protein [Acidobacteriota bacterium]MYB31514.1 CPBP family intramembrane metalloprotease [Acidobacteriota bacterium]MYH21246.1 CPBP family intramembrane metalloprotease [Acidobacteriota bacterium]MYK79224.1 CPBP family intramembrane metalloprotease [Acidobacteriota bacterium]